MTIGMVLTPLDRYHMRLARQIGVDDLVIRYPGPRAEDLDRVVEVAASEGMRVGVVEGFLPIADVQLGTAGRDQQLDELTLLIENMGRSQISTLCYNWMALTDWTRTAVDVPGRGGARCTQFDLKAANALPAIDAPEVSEAQLWDNLQWMIERLVPVAEAAGVTLAMHPDDPPISPMRGLSRIMTSIDAFDRLLGMSSSPANAICFCQGTFATMGVDVAATIRGFGSRIAFVHIRDIRGSSQHFDETFHDALGE